MYRLLWWAAAAVAALLPPAAHGQGGQFELTIIQYQHPVTQKQVSQRDRSEWRPESTYRDGRDAVVRSRKTAWFTLSGYYTGFIVKRIASLGKILM